MSDGKPSLADWTMGAEAIVYQSCAACGNLQYFRRSFCVACGEPNPAEQRASGEATVYATSLVCRAATPETALLLTARALEPLRGPKALVFFGWGMGTLSGSMVFLDADYGPARQALLDARVTVFSLDVTDADYHTLEVGLEQVAAEVERPRRP